MRRPVATAETSYLRRPAADDGDEFVSRVRDSHDHLRPFVKTADTPGAFRQWLLRGERLDVEQFLVCRREDHAIAGFANLNTIIRGSLQQAFAGWASFVPLHGQGHLTEGVRMLQAVAFTQLRLHRIEANIQPTNEASRRLAVRTGFRLEGYSPRYLKVGGEWRDHERWAVLESDWRGRQPTT